MSVGQEDAVDCSSALAAEAQRIDNFLRIALVIYASALFFAAGGFAMRARWTEALWPFSYTEAASFAFMASIIAAAAAPTLWCALRRDYRALVGGGIDAIVITAPVAIYLLFVVQRKSLQMLALAALITTAIACIVTVRYWRYPFRDTRATPLLLRIAFVAFILVLAGPGIRMIGGNARVLPWYVTREIAVIYGWAFLGTAVYFVYALLYPNWSNAIGQLLGTLVYDVVLIGPLLGHFSRVEPEQQINLIVYTCAVAFSAGVAIFYCLINPTTSVFASRRAGHSAQTPRIP